MLALLLFVTLLFPVDEGLATGVHEVHHPGQLVGGGGIGARLVHAGAQAPIERAERRIAAGWAHCRHLQRLTRPVGRALGNRGQHPLIWVPGHRPSQRRSADAGEAAQVRADLRQQLHHHGHSQAVDAREVNTRPVGQCLARVDSKRSLAPRARLCPNRRGARHAQPAAPAVWRRSARCRARSSYIPSAWARSSWAWDVVVATADSRASTPGCLTKPPN